MLRDHRLITHMHQPGCSDLTLAPSCPLGAAMWSGPLRPQARAEAGGAGVEPSVRAWPPAGKRGGHRHILRDRGVSFERAIFFWLFVGPQLTRRSTLPASRGALFTKLSARCLAAGLPGGCSFHQGSPRCPRLALVLYGRVWSEQLGLPVWADETQGMPVSRWKGNATVEVVVCSPSVA